MKKVPLAFCFFILVFSFCFSVDSLAIKPHKGPLFFATEDSQDLLIDSEGSVVYRFTGVLKDAMVDNSGYILIEKDGLGLVYDREGHFLFYEPQLNFIESVGSSGFIASYWQQDLRSLVSRDGRKVLLSGIENWRNPNKNYLALQLKKKWGIYDLAKQAWLVEPRYENLSRLGNNRMANEANDVYTMMSFDGKVIIGLERGFQYFTFARSVDCALGIDKDGKAAIYDSWGKRLDWGTPAWQSEIYGAEFFSDGACIMTDSAETRYYYIDAQGRRLGDKSYEVAKPFSEGLAFVKEKAGAPCFSCIDKSGKVVFVLPPKVKTPMKFKDGLAMLGDDIDGWAESGYVDRTGRIVWWAHL